MSGGHVDILDLASNNLQGGFQIVQGDLNSLTTLYLGGNQLTSFDGTGL